jgi:hypothetical protein
MNQMPPNIYSPPSAPCILHLFPTRPLPRPALRVRGGPSSNLLPFISSPFFLNNINHRRVGALFSGLLFVKLIYNSVTMSDPNERQEDASNPPYPPSQYPNPPSSYNYPADYAPLPEHDLSIAGQGYPQPIPLATQLQEAAQQTTRAGDGEPMRVTTNGAGMPGMGPPQPQGAQGFSPEGHRPSVDASNTSTPVDQQSKRGKASQACDECRRKKVRYVRGA